MSSNKRSASAEKELKATVKKLRTKLERAEARADSWKKKAGRHEKSAAESEAQVKKLSKLNKRLDKAAARPAGSRKSAVSTTSTDPTDTETLLLSAEPPGTVTLLESTSDVDPSFDVESASVGPDDSWTVVQLRAEARTRGLTGLSSMSKAQLLAALA